MKIRHIITVIALVACTTQAGAQNIFSRFYHNWLVKPRNVDSTYIYQQHLGFSPSLTGNFSQQSLRMTTTFDFDEMPYYDENLDDIVFLEDVRMLFTDRMKEALSTRAGFILALGRLGLGWSFELSPDSRHQSSAFMFSFRGNKFGLNINYLDFSQSILEEAVFTPSGIEGFESYTESVDSNRLRRLTLDGFYVINTRRFAYPPGIAGNMVQLRSAGSWLLAGRYMQSDITPNPEYSFASFGMIQGSIGCGYSYTWVPWSRQPRFDGTGMRTFFINGTLIPMLTVLNHFTIRPYDMLLDFVGANKRSVFCWPTPNLLVNATVGFSWSKFYFGAQFNYNVFQFNTRNAISPEELHLSDEGSSLNIMGLLYEWNIGLKFQACF